MRGSSLLTKLKESTINLFGDSEKNKEGTTTYSLTNKTIETLKVKAVADAKKDNTLPIGIFDLRSDKTEKICPLANDKLYIFNKNSKKLEEYTEVFIKVDKHGRITDEINGYKSISFDVYEAMLLKYNKTYIRYGILGIQK